MEGFSYLWTKSYQCRLKNRHERWLDVAKSVASSLCDCRDKDVSLGQFYNLTPSSMRMLSLHRPAGLSSPFIPHILLSSLPSVHPFFPSLINPSGHPCPADCGTMWADMPLTGWCSPLWWSSDIHAVLLVSYIEKGHYWCSKSSLQTWL